MKKHSVSKLLAFALIGLVALPLGARGEEVAALKTPLVTAANGMVVAQEAIAARIGVDVLKNGGNAVDAAVAVGFAMAVTYPRAGNIGGGGFMVIHRAGGEDTVIDYRETAPAAINATSFLDAQGNADPQKSREVRARHRRAGHRRGAGDGGSEIRLRPFHAGRADRAGDRARPRRHRGRRRHRGFAPGRPGAAGALAVLGARSF